MSFLESLGAFLPGIVSGILLVELLWEDRRLWAVLLKACLGAGLGLGLTSLLYFLYMLAFAGGQWFLYIQIALLALLLWLAVRRGRLHAPQIDFHARPQLWQALILVCVLPIVVFAVAGALSVWTHRPFGTWDAFMIYDRSARFVYRGGTDWMQTFSPDIDPAFHADYPLLISMEIAQAWDTLGHESQSVPRVLGGIFMLVCAGLFVSALTMLKSIWQATLGLVVLLNTPFFILSGPSQTADVPLSFFILAAVVLLFLFCTEQKPGLLVLAGLSTGLAAWTKNEGDVFVITILAGLFVAFLRHDVWRRLGYFLAGLAVPLAIVLYFKVFLAPANDILGTGMAGLIQRAFEWSRHLAILRSFRGQILIIGGPTVSVILLLAIYALIFGVSPQRSHLPAYVAIAITATIQAAGYYVIYLVTPHPIQWQLDFSLWRVLFHIYLPLLFVFFVLVADVPRALGFQREAVSAESAT